MDLLSLRLSNQRLIGKKFQNPQDVVAHLGAVQSQDFTAAKWSLGLRLSHATDETIEHAYNKGKILRTHAMRPTWHFVVPEDIFWLQKLTSPRVKILLGHYNRKLELTDAIFTKTNELMIKVLRHHKNLTRQELKKELETIGVKTDIQRLAHIIMWAELDCLIISGPKRGKQFTYALFDERVPRIKELSRDESLARLAEKYFTSHGPAQLKDFAWWSGLSVKDATEGLSIRQSKLESIKINDKTYWFPRAVQHSQTSKGNTFLLSVYDEYFISYTDRSNLLEPQYREKLPIGNALLTSLIIIDGKVAGTWKRILKKNKLELKLFPFESLNKLSRDKIEQIAKEYGNFFGTETSVII